jgi:hypothetical protein
VPALGDLGAQLTLQPLGLALALGLTADLALAAGHRVDAGVDDDLVAVAAPPGSFLLALRSVADRKNR